MFRSRIIPAAMVAVMAMGAAGTAFAESGEHENRKEVTAVLGAKTSVAHPELEGAVWHGLRRTP